MARSTKGARRYNIPCMGEQMGHLHKGWSSCIGLTVMFQDVPENWKSSFALALGIVAAGLLALYVVFAWSAASAVTRIPDSALNPPIYPGAQQVVDSRAE